MTIDLVTLDAILAEFERLHDRCEQQLLKLTEAPDLVSKLEARARAALPLDSDALRIYDRRVRQGGNWWKVTSSGYASGEDCTNISKHLEALRQAIDVLSPSFLRSAASPQQQLYFQAGEVFRAKQAFFHLLMRATLSIDLVDPWLDPEIFDYLEYVPRVTAVRLVTDSPKSLFRSQLHQLQGHGSTITAKSVSWAHDRFLLIDSTELWHLGCSVNGLGKKAAMINRVADAKAIATFQSNLLSWWNMGTTI